MGSCGKLQAILFDLFKNRKQSVVLNGQYSSATDVLAASM